MVSAEAFCAALRLAGYDFFSGVPCSYLRGPLEILEREPDYVPAPNEGIALSTAAGAALAGRRSVVLAQNSGLGNLLDPLTSLLLAYRLPVLLVMSLRGWPTAQDDEPHHEVMGRSAAALLHTVGVSSATLDGSAQGLHHVLTEAQSARARREPFAMLVPKGTVAAVTSSVNDGDTPADGRRFRREDAVRVLTRRLEGRLVISTTGMISRELFGRSDTSRNFYMQGSMGHAVGLALGLSEAAPDAHVVLVDGDGAALMHLGGMALVGERSPSRLLHVLIDNGVYDSTGGQRVRQRPIPWGIVAEQFGYRKGWVCHGGDEFDAALEQAMVAEGPALVAVCVEPGGCAVPPRINTEITNPDLAARFAAEVQAGFAPSLEAFGGR